MTPIKDQAKAPEREFERLTLNQRIQHWILIASFISLVITGMPVRYPESPISHVMVRLMGGVTLRAALHRFWALVLISLCAYHLFYVLFSRRGREDLGEFIPSLKDAKDLIKMLKVYFGLSMDKPKFGRYNYIEKFEYFAMGWGSVVMVGTGLALWFEEQALIILPKWALDVANIIHSYEALLAFLAIVIWHFYHVHLNPESFPMSKIWLTGKITEHELRELHPLEYEDIKAKERRGENLGLGGAV
ncbi:MAG: cytochrome b/b6 domain-containing protein [Armatimonadota bacterium]|nr:cytochrome b/b6 domain-containing protein [Armatimonadota bacterium]